jgi:hypothetical protein
MRLRLQIALVITMRKAQAIGDRVREAMKLVTDWCKDAGLHLAQEKTEIILLTGKRVPKVFKFDVGNGEITTRNTVRYLGVLMNNARRYSPIWSKRVIRRRGLLEPSGALSNMNRPTDTVRRLYYGVWESVFLYAAPIWASVLSLYKNRTILKSAQRAALVRTSTTYRTVSHGALCVVTGSMLIHIKARLPWKEYKVKSCFKNNLLGNSHDRGVEKLETRG